MGKPHNKSLLSAKCSEISPDMCHSISKDGETQITCRKTEPSSGEDKCQVERCRHNHKAKKKIRSEKTHHLFASNQRKQLLQHASNFFATNGVRFHIGPSKEFDERNSFLGRRKFNVNTFNLVSNSFENKGEHIFVVRKEKGTPFK